MGVCSQVDDSLTIISNCHHENIIASKQCFYSVTELRDRLPWREDNMTTPGIEMTLWVAASHVSISEPVDPEPHSLGVFYTLYLPDTGVYPFPDSLPNFTEHTIALKRSFNLCVLSCQTTVENIITKTEERARTTDLKWQSVEQNNNNSITPAISTSTGCQDYWITHDSLYAIQELLLVRNIPRA